MFLANKNLEIRDHREWFPNTSFGIDGPTLDFIHEAGYYVVSSWRPYNREIEQLINTAPYLEGNTVYNVNVAPLGST
jgi:hypothetical protein